MKRVLFLCTGNSCRSQMAEAIVNARLAGESQAVSAGTKPAGYMFTPKPWLCYLKLEFSMPGGRSLSMNFVERISI